MYSAKNYIHRFILLLIVSSFTIDPVSSIKCYQCASIAHADCKHNSEQRRYEVECSVDDLVPGVTLIPPLGSNTEFECLRASYVSKVRVYNIEYFYRGCIPKGRKCDAEHIAPMLPSLRNIEMKLGLCDTCNSDLCNSTVLLSAEMWILTLSLIIQLQLR